MFDTAASMIFLAVLVWIIYFCLPMAHWQSPIADWLSLTVHLALTTVAV